MSRDYGRPPDSGPIEESPVTSEASQVTPSVHRPMIIKEELIELQNETAVDVASSLVQVTIREEAAYNPPSTIDDLLKSASKWHCNYCPKTFNTEGRLKVHLSMFHSDIPADAPAPVFTCPACALTFARRDALQLHSLTHLERLPSRRVPERLFCNQCGASLPYGEPFRKHQAEHEAEKNREQKMLGQEKQLNLMVPYQLKPLSQKGLFTLVPNGVGLPSTLMAPMFMPQPLFLAPPGRPILPKPILPNPPPPLLTASSPTTLRKRSTAKTRKLPLPPALPELRRRISERIKTVEASVNPEIKEEIDDHSVECLPVQADPKVPEETVPTPTVPLLSSSSFRIEIPTTSSLNMVNPYGLINGTPLYVCPQCSGLFATFPHLEAHMLTHYGPRSWACEACLALFKLKIDLKRHRVVRHQLMDFVTNEIHRVVGPREGSEAQQTPQQQELVKLRVKHQESVKQSQQIRLEGPKIFLQQVQLLQQPQPEPERSVSIPVTPNIGPGKKKSTKSAPVVVADTYEETAGSPITTTIVQVENSQDKDDVPTIERKSPKPTEERRASKRPRVVTPTPLPAKPPSVSTYQARGIQWSCCALCPAMFATEEALKEHREVKHGQVDSSGCRRSKRLKK